MNMVIDLIYLAWLNKEMRNLYIVSSPFQCVNAIEAKSQFDLKNNILVSVYYSKDSKEVSSQMKEVITLSDWDKVIEIGVKKKKSKLFEYVSVIKKLKNYKFDNVFIGHFGQFQEIALANLSIKKIFSIDDGVVTLKLHKIELNPNKNSNKKLLKRIKMLRYSLFGLKTSFDKKRLNYFTMFDLKPYYGEEVIENKFMFMKKFSSSKHKDSKCVLLLGQPLYEVGLIDKKNYIKFLETIKGYFKQQGVHIRYIPHRREKDLQYMRYLEDDYFNIKYLSMPVELYLLKTDILPVEVFSFISTALFSIQKIFSIKTGAFYIEKEFFLRNYENIEQTYKELKDNGVNIVKLN